MANETQQTANEIITNNKTSQGSNGGILRYPSDMSKMSHLTKITIKKNLDSDEIIKLIYLPLPNEELQFTQSVQLQSVEGLAEGSFRSQLFKPGADLSADTFVNSLAAESVKALKGALSTTRTGEVFLAARGKAINNFEAQAFKNVTFRLLDMNFTFTPRNELEALETNKIVKLFRKSMLPSFGDFFEGSQVSGTEETQGEVTLPTGIFEFPYVFEIEFVRYNNNPIGNEDSITTISKMKKCYLETCSVSYGTDTVFLQNDYPAITTLNAAFREIQVLTQKDIDRGY